jgi:predicted nuclease of predicted toxin-antitoxin system
MKLLLDQGLPRTAAPLLRAQAIDTVHVGEMGMATAEDAAILQRAREDGRVVVTLDADFHTLLALNAAPAPSVIRIRIERLRAQAATDLLLRVMAECGEALQRGAAVTVEPGRIRLRYLPLGAAGE